MPTRNKDITPAEMESQLHDADRYLNELLPRSEEDIREAIQMYGTTPVDVPERLRSGKDVLARIKQQDTSSGEPSEFGKLITMLRTKKKLTIERLAEKTDLDADELQQIEKSCEDVAGPLAVAELSKFFKLNLRKVERIAGLTQQREGSDLDCSLSFAASASGNFADLSSTDKKVFHQIVKQLRK